MKILKNIIQFMVRWVKRSNYNCSPWNFYKPQRCFQKNERVMARSFENIKR